MHAVRIDERTERTAEESYSPAPPPDHMAGGCWVTLCFYCTARNHITLSHLDACLKAAREDGAPVDAWASMGDNGLEITWWVGKSA